MRGCATRASCWSAPRGSAATRRCRLFPVMTSPPSRTDALRQVLEGTRLDRTALDGRVAEALDPAYWRRLCPALSIGAAAAPGPERTSLDADARRDLTRRLREE